MSASNGIGLDDIPGLGPVRRAALAEAGVNDLEGLLALKAAQLSEIRGIGAWQARRIWEFLRQRGLLVADEEADGSVSVHLTQPRTAAEARAITEAAEALDAQSAAEAEVEAEVVALAEALEGASTREPGKREAESPAAPASTRARGPAAHASTLDGAAEREP